MMIEIIQNELDIPDNKLVAAQRELANTVNISQRYSELLHKLSVTTHEDNDIRSLFDSQKDAIRRSLEYQAVGRKLLLVDETNDPYIIEEQGDHCYILTEDYQHPGLVDTRTIDKEDQDDPVVEIPTFKIKTTQRIKEKHIQKKRFVVIDRMAMLAKQIFEKEENTIIFTALIHNAEEMGNVITTGGGDGRYTLHDLNTAFAYLEQQNRIVTKIVMHPRQYATMRMWKSEFLHEATALEILTTNLIAHFWTADVHTSVHMPKNKILLCTSADQVGTLAIKKNIDINVKFLEKHIKVNYKEEIGLGFYENRCVILEVPTVDTN